MRVLHVFANQELNGAAVHCLSLAELQIKAGHEVIVAVSDQDGYVQSQCREMDIDCVVLPSLRPDSDPQVADSTPEDAVEAVKTAVSAIRPDVTHTHLRWARNIALPASCSLGIATIHTQHDEPTINAFMERQMRTYSDVLMIAVSSGVKNKMVEAGIQSHRISVVLNGVGALPSDGFVAPRRELPTFLLSCRLVPEKGWDTAIRAIALLRARGVEVCLEIAGDGWQRREVEALIRELEVSDLVRLHGLVEHPVNANCTYRALLAPSRTDTSPLIILEAMSAGLPVIASAVGDIRELLRDCESSHVLTHPDDVSELAFHMELAASRPIIRDVSARYRYLTRFTREVMFRNTMVVYENATS
jgi:glycosyltransferase involved in cell wall biosynthesis